MPKSQGARRIIRQARKNPANRSMYSHPIEVRITQHPIRGSTISPYSANTSRAVSAFSWDVVLRFYHESVRTHHAVIFPWNAVCAVLHRAQICPYHPSLRPRPCFPTAFKHHPPGPRAPSFTGSCSVKSLPVAPLSPLRLSLAFCSKRESAAF